MIETQDSKAWLRQARRAQNSGDIRQAHETYARVTDLDPDDSLAWLGRSETASHPDEKLVSLGFALALDRENRVIQERFEQRLEQRLTQAQASEAAHLVELGREFALVGLPDPALRLAQRACDLDPQLTTAWLWRASLLQDPQEAARSVRQAASLDPELPAVRAAMLWAEAARPTATPPPVKPAASGPGPDVAQAKTGRAPGSASLRQRIADARPGPTAQPTEIPPGTSTVAPESSEASSVAVLAPTLPASPRPKLAPSSQESASLSPADTVEEMLNEGERLMGGGAKPEALRLFVQATERDPLSERGWLWRASATEDVDEALTSLEQALAINPENTQAREARTFLRIRKLREGVKSRTEASDSPGVSAAKLHVPRSRQALSPSARRPGGAAQARVVLLILVLVILIASLTLLYLKLH